MSAENFNKGRPPELVGPFGFPEWFHHHGDKIQIKSVDLEKKTVVMCGSAASLTISPDIKYTEKSLWDIDWEVIQGYPDFKTNGRTIMKTDQVATAFGVSDKPSRYGQWLIDRFGGDFAEQFGYIRWHNFLNIPCPGTGHDGDPNISIFLTDEIKEAVRQILGL